MNTQILEQIGLTKTEIKIYLALLKLGQTTTTNIVKEAEIHASKVYEFLEKLIQKGLVSYVIKSNKKYFSASNPAFLKEFMREKENKIKEQEKEIDNLLPELKEIQLSGKDIIQSEIYEGLKGLKSVYEKILTTLGKNEIQYIIGAPKVGNELLEGYLLDWHKKRLKKGIKCKIIYDSDAKEYGEVRAKMPLTEVKYMPKDMNSPMWIEIWGDYVAIGHIKERNSILFLIHDKGIAKGYIDYFNLIWKVSKK
jgi:sugar-specific transcriptional regulator TrmB